MITSETTEQVRMKRCILRLRDHARLYKWLELSLKELEGKGYLYAALYCAFFLDREITVSNVRSLARMYDFPIKKGATLKDDSYQECSETQHEENPQRLDEEGHSL